MEKFVNLQIMKKHFFLILTTIASLSIQAKLVVTQTSCNYQKGEMALVEDKIRLGWQYIEDADWPISQTRYQIEIHERVTGRLIYDSKVVLSGES